MKKWISLIVFFISLVSFSQNSESNNLVNYEKFGIKIAIDNSSDLKNFKLPEIETIYREQNEFEKIEFEISYNYEKNLDFGKINHVTFTVDGTSDKLDEFINNIKLVTTKIEKLYN